MGTFWQVSIWRTVYILNLLLALVHLAACSAPPRAQEAAPIAAGDAEIETRLARYAPVTLSVDASALSHREKRLVHKLAAAAALIERAYWE